MKPTEEQQHALDVAKSGQSLVLEAMAGTGKSSTLRLVAQAMPTRRMLYTAFSASVIADAKAGGFGNCRIQSNHSLAFASHGAAMRNAGRMERRLTPRVVVATLGLYDAQFPENVKAEGVALLALEAVLRFQQSADDSLQKHHFRLPAPLREKGVHDEVVKVARSIWQHLSSSTSTMPVTHDTYLKLWALSRPRLPYQAILLDEGQDANAVIVDVLASQGAQLIVVGDRRQQIFSWRGAVNAMDAFPIEQHAALTQSFRFGPVIAEAANAVLSAHADSDRFVRGFDAINSRIGPVPKSARRAELARTNATLIGRVAELANEGRRVAIVGGVNDMLLLVDGAAKLQRGELALNCPDLRDFRNWKEVESYAGEESGRDLAVLVKLVNARGCWGLTQLLERVKNNEKHEDSCDVVLSTAHRAKGREWDNVVIHDDFPTPTDADLAGLPSEEKSKWTPEEANLLYVALTRAKKVLDPIGVDAWRDAVDRCMDAGVDLPGVTDDDRFSEAA